MAMAVAVMGTAVAVTMGTAVAVISAMGLIESNQMGRSAVVLQPFCSLE